MCFDKAQPGSEISPGGIVDIGESEPRQKLGELSFTAYHAQIAALSISLNDLDGRSVAPTLSAARVDIRPHQVECAIFALGTPLTRGALLADETGLGKTIEAGIVIAQRWAERRRAILLIVPATLLPQWRYELFTKFGLRAVVLDGPGVDKMVRQHGSLIHTPQVLLMSFGVASTKAHSLAATPWDLVVIDEAHRLRNVYKARAESQSRRIREALKGRTKILLTATPLQNSLMELHGLLSFIDDGAVGSTLDFETLYAKNPKADDLSRLADLIRPLVKRHLRSDVQKSGHVAYTNRIAATYAFEPYEEELQLYDSVSAYLQREETMAFGSPPNPLILTTARKILASSTAATAGFLRTVLVRLRRLEAMDAASLDDVEDLCTVAQEARDIEDGCARSIADAETMEPRPFPTRHTSVSPVFADEIEEVERYLALAEGIAANAKGDKLIETLPGILDEVCSRGGARKAVIFTESRKTQDYLTALLRERKMVAQIITLNGRNSDGESARIHQDWCARHAADGTISGLRAADMKVAIVEAFLGTEPAILVSTESGGEGINLQGCSLIINYDLPWNPQRLEQRIGRCHRYGQRIDVLVLNFQNTRNKVETRILYLLTKKFKIFEGVFGASNDVLGAIEANVDFGAEVLRIAQTCRSDAEVEREFAALERRLEEVIAGDLAAARRALFDLVDEGVVARLNARDERTLGLLDDYTRRLGIVVRAELPAAIFDDHAPLTFQIDGTTWTTRWADVPSSGARHFALGEGRWASQIVDVAAARSLPVANVRFDLDALRRAGFGRLSDVERYAGRAGWIRVTHLTFVTALETAAPRAALVMVGLADDGEVIDADTAARFFLVPGSLFERCVAAVPAGKLDEIERVEQARLVDLAKSQNAAWQVTESDRLEAQIRDMHRAAEVQARELMDKAEWMRTKLHARSDLSPEEKNQARREISAVEREGGDIIMTFVPKLAELREKLDHQFDEVEASLRITPQTRSLFEIRWEMT